MRLQHQTDIRHDVYICEPHWSWYGTPLWRTTATVLTIHCIDFTAQYTFQTGALTSKSFKEPDGTFFQYVYFTAEEFVMFKMTHPSHSNGWDGEILGKGITYN